jgi:hypothetical protein
VSKGCSWNQDFHVEIGKTSEAIRFAAKHWLAIDYDET